MNIQPDNGDLKEAWELRKRTQAWLEELQNAGVPTSVIASSTIAVLIELVLVDRGKEATVRWLEAQARLAGLIGDGLVATRKSS